MCPEEADGCTSLAKRNERLPWGSPFEPRWTPGPPDAAVRGPRGGRSSSSGGCRVERWHVVEVVVRQIVQGIALGDSHARAVESARVVERTMVVTAVSGLIDLTGLLRACKWALAMIAEAPQAAGSRGRGRTRYREEERRQSVHPRSSTAGAGNYMGCRGRLFTGGTGLRRSIFSCSGRNHLGLNRIFKVLAYT